MTMSDQALLRYSRQIMLPEIDVQGQERLVASRVLVIGLGGLGASSSIYLTTAGVGHLVLVDFDKVELSNLQRQIIHTTNDIDRLKVESAKEHLLALNPHIKVTTIKQKMDDQNLASEVQAATTVLDCSDNFETRFAVNRACVRYKTPLVSAAAIRFEAQLSVFDSNDETSPCYRCLYGDEAEAGRTCTDNGVLAPLLGIIGSAQACEAMKVIMRIGETLQGKLLMLDALAMEWRTIRLPKDPSCPVCGLDRD